MAGEGKETGGRANPCVLKRKGRYSLHAAGFAVDGQGLLLLRVSGCGKTTLTLSLLRAGYGFLGDNTVFLTCGPRGVQVLGFPDEIDASEKTLASFPELAGTTNRPRAPGSPKWQMLAEDVYAVDLVPACKPRVLVFAQVTDAEHSRLSRLERGEALVAMSSNAMLTEARSAQAHLDILAELARTCDCYRLETGRDFDAIPSLLRGLLE